MPQNTHTSNLFPIAGICITLGLLLAGCGGGGGSSTTTATGTPLPVPGPYASRAVCAATTPTPGIPKWTILIYMEAGNNLQPDSLINVSQIASVGSNANVNIVLQWKQIPASMTNSCPNCDPSFYGVRRYFIHPHDAADVTAIANGNTTVMAGDRLPDPSANVPVNTSGFTDTLPDPNGKPNGTEDMGSYHALADFVKWGTTNYPASHTALLIWDHGSGWENVYRSIKAATAQPMRAVAADDEYTDEIETWELPQALSATVRPLDMVILDCSLEEMAEVAYEIRNNASVMVGSEESPPAPGYPYDKWIADLEADGGNDTPCDLGNHIITEFVNDPSYLNSSYSSVLTQSMLDLSKMNGFAQSLNAFAGVMNEHVQDQSALFARLRTDPVFPDRIQGGAQHFATEYRDYKDLWDYADLIRTESPDTDMQQAALNLENTLTGEHGVILEAKEGPTGEEGAHGLSIYVPAPSSYLTAYNNLSLTLAAPLWPRFLLAQTQ